MDATVQCPVCTLFLHEGMALSAHLDTHPKDQVISALCNLAVQSSAPATPASTPAPLQSSPITFSSPTLSTSSAPPPYNHIEHTHRPRVRPPYTPVPPTPSSTPIPFSDHPIYFLQQPPRTPYSRHSENTSFVFNNKFTDNDGLIMAFVQPQIQEQLNMHQSGQQQYDTKPPVHLVMPVKTPPQPVFYKQLTHQVSVKKYVSTVPLAEHHSDQQHPVMVVVGESEKGTPGPSTLDVSKGDSNTSSSTKSGVKILSNIKVELPIQSIPEIIDLTSTHHRPAQRPDLHEDEAILPDFVDAETCHNYSQTRFREHYASQTPASVSSSPLPLKLSSGESVGGSVVNTFSVIKNIGNPNLYKDSSQHSEDNKGSDNSILPDLTCNENPSISPCSELTNDSNEPLYDRIAGTGRAASLCVPTTPIVMYQNNRFTTSEIRTALGASSNSLFNELNQNNKTVSVQADSNVGGFSVQGGCDSEAGAVRGQEVGRLDGFFKEFEKNSKPSTTIPSLNVTNDKTKLLCSKDSNVDGDSNGSSLTDQDSNMSCESNNKEEERSICSRENTSENINLKHCLPERDLGVERLMDNLSQKSYIEMENMRSVNVIAFGSVLSGVSGDMQQMPTSGAASTSYHDISKSDPYSDFFNTNKENVASQWSGHVREKEEFVLSSFMDMGQGGVQFTRANGTSCTTDGEGLRTSTEIVNLHSKSQCEDGGRGELSEQDTPWPGMYCDVVGGSTSYDLLARETWHSDGSEVDMPITPAKDLYNDGEEPIVVGVKPPERNYRCGSCGKSFNCPKERRVHRSNEHPTTMSQEEEQAGRQEGQQSLPAVLRKNRKKTTSAGNAPTLLKPIHIKNELVQPEVATPANKMKEEVSNSNSCGVADSGAIAFEEDRKPKLEEDGGVLGGLGLPGRVAKKRKKEWVCGTCKQEFPGQNEYNQHLKEHPLECLTCGKYFYRRSNMQLHIKRHLGIKNYKCDICEKRFITKQKMLEHYYGHTGNTPVKCGLCPETFRRHSNMVQHRNKHHFLLKKKLRDYVCDCGEVFHTKKKLAWHKEIHEDRPKACPHCSEKFIHAASLTRHMRRAHNTLFNQAGDGNVKCKICHQVYLRTSLESHMRTHAGARPHLCHICNKSFTTKWNLKLHRWTHANRSSKPFKCSLCKGAFIRQADYVSHMNSHKSVRPYTCNYCGCQFIRKYNCQRHVKEHENDKKFACQVADCGKSFHRSYYLAEHMRVHSGHRPFSCNICGKTSSTKSNHNKHIKIHHAREPVSTEG